MNHKIDQDTAIESCEWSFPDIKYVASTYLDIQEKQPDTKNALDIQLEKQQKEHIQALNELKKTQQEYEEKIALLQTILQQTDNPLNAINNDVVLLLKTIIENAVKKIILKEIQLEPKLITDLIDELKLLIHSQDNSLIIVYLSEADYNLLDLKMPHTALSFRINKELSSGDLIIKSNTAEVRSILSDRIDKMLGGKA